MFRLINLDFRLSGSRVVKTLECMHFGRQLVFVLPLSLLNIFRKSTNVFVLNVVRHL